MQVKKINFENHYQEEKKKKDFPCVLNLECSWQFTF